MNETFQQAIERFCRQREEAAEQQPDARDRLLGCIEAGVATGPGDTIPRLLFEYCPRSLRDPRVAALDATLTERQVAVYYGVLLLGEAQGHFVLTGPARELANNFVALEDGYQMDVLSGRRHRDEVLHQLHGFATTVTGCTLRP